MSSNNKTIYTCSHCDAQSSKWSGRCSECGKWGTLTEGAKDSRSLRRSGPGVPPAEIIDFGKLTGSEITRINTGISEVDRVFGGGIVPGSLVLLAGEPGIGKSTIVLQIACGVRTDRSVLYVSGEESAVQVKSRLDRLGRITEKLKFVSETDVDRIIATIEKEKPAMVIIDSIQTVHTSMVESEAGSVSQIRASASLFLEAAKQKDIAFMLIGHVTKDGMVAGPKTLEHIVDTVIYLESEQQHGFRILRATKNRFGSVNEIGIFTMTAVGFSEVTNPAAAFLDTNDGKLPGSIISCVMEGTRPFLVEVQALVTKTVFGYPQRKASGFDLNRLQILTAVLTKRAGINLTNQDVIVNVVGGLKVSDPALDLAICMAITSSLLNQTIDRKILVLGEVGLGGEIRKAGKLNERLKEAVKLGFGQAIVPEAKITAGKIKLNKVKNLKEIVRASTGRKEGTE